MADQQRRRAVVASRHEGPKGIGAFARLFRRFDAVMPPLRRQMSKIMVRKPRCKQTGRTADITHKSGLFANFPHDFNRYLMNSEDRLRGLQCAGVRRDDDARQGCVRELHRGCRRLLDAKRRQFRIFNPRIDPSLVEMQVKITLAMAQQKHRCRNAND